MRIRSHETVVDEQFGPRAEAYANSAVHSTGEDLTALAAIVGDRPQAAALDLGCGSGHVALLLAPLVSRVVAYDLSEAMVAMTRAQGAKRGLSNLEVRRGVAERLPYSDAAFDIVVSRYSVHHWHDAAAGLREARRVLKPGGLAVFMDTVAPGAPLLDTWLQALELLRDSSHVRNYTLAQWHGMLAGAGFGPASTRCYRIGLQFQSWIERMNTPAVNVAALRALQSIAPEGVVRHFELQSDGSFSVDSMLMQMGG
jgi:SAM-dependent methyltransferase